MSVLPNHDHSSAVDRLTDVTGEIREFVRQQNLDGQAVAGDLVSLLGRAAQNSMQEIDQVMAELQRLREKVRGDGARVQRHLVEYATLAQSTLQTTKVISDSLQSRFPKRSP